MNIADSLDYPMASEEFRDKMLEYLLKDVDEYELTKEDIKRINEIKAAQFDTWEWNMGKSPKFSRTIENRFAGGKLSISTEVKKGIITDIAFHGISLQQRI